VSWVKLDDGFADHPKVVGLSDRAFRAHVAALCYASRQATDGRVPYTASRALGLSDRSAGELVNAGLWVRNGLDWQIKDFLDYNPSRTLREQKRHEAAERMRHVRANKARRS